MTTIEDIASVLEQAAPLGIAADYDNVGLIVGHPQSEIRSVLLCLDVTEQVMDEAQRLGVGMVISHHPIIFHPLRRLNGAGYVERIVERAIKSGIALYASHTNLDATQGGLSHRLAEILDLRVEGVLSPSCGDDPSVGYGVVGELRSDMAVGDFMKHLKTRLNLSVIRHSDLCREQIRRVAICSGSGASLIEAAAGAEADIYIAADFKYNDFMSADGRLIVADVGHFESEYCSIDLMYDIIIKKMPTFVLYKSENSRNPINYLV